MTILGVVACMLRISQFRNLTLLIWRCQNPASLGLEKNMAVPQTCIDGNKCVDELIGLKNERGNK